jgi:hypothetical protein
VSGSRDPIEIGDKKDDDKQQAILNQRMNLLQYAGGNPAIRLDR